MAAQTRILICDDHVLVRSGLRRLLEGEADLTVIGEAADAEDAIATSRLEQPDIILLDVAMPGRSGIAAIPELLAATPTAKILMLSMQDDPAYVRQAFAAGAHGYLLKAAADGQLVQAIHELAEGRRFIYPLLAARERSTDMRPRSGPLSEREQVVLGRLARGETNREIAKHLFISIRSAEADRAGIAQKLGLKTRAEIVQYVLANETEGER